MWNRKAGESREVPWWKADATLAVALCAYVSLFWLLLKAGIFSYGMEGAYMRPEIVWYFSASKPVNEALYVVFYPCVATLERSHPQSLFATSGYNYWAVAQGILDEKGYHRVRASDSGWSLAKASAPWLWGALLVGWMVRRLQHRDRAEAKTVREKSSLGANSLVVCLLSPLVGVIYSLICSLTVPSRGGSHDVMASLFAVSVILAILALLCDGFAWRSVGGLVVGIVGFTVLYAV